MIKTFPVTFHLPCGDASAVKLIREFEALAARLAIENGWELQVSKRLMAPCFEFTPRYVPSRVIQIFGRDVHANTHHTTSPSAA